LLLLLTSLLVFVPIFISIKRRIQLSEPFIFLRSKSNYCSFWIAIASNEYERTRQRSLGSLVEN